MGKLSIGTQQKEQKQPVRLGSAQQHTTPVIKRQGWQATKHKNFDAHTQKSELIKTDKYYVKSKEGQYWQHTEMPKWEGDEPEHTFGAEPFNHFNSKESALKHIAYLKQQGGVPHDLTVESHFHAEPSSAEVSHYFKQRLHQANQFVINRKGPMDKTEVIKEAKALLKHLQDNPQDVEKLSKGIPEGVVSNPLRHRKPASEIKGVHISGNKPEVGQSHAGYETEMGHHDEAKKQHMNILAEAKALHEKIKNKLPKSEMAKEEKGINLPAKNSVSGLGDKKGQSEVGQMTRIAGQEKLSQGHFQRKAAKIKHTNVLSDLKNMSAKIANKLPKTEMKSQIKKCGDMIAAKKAKK